MKIKSDLFGVIPTKDKLDKFIYDLVYSWHRTLIEYEKEWTNITNFLPYVYNETAQTGMLAIAARKIGGFPFLEFTQDKKTKTGRGQQDLEIISPDHNVWSFEAKYLEIEHAENNLTTRLKNKLISAVSDIQDIKKRDKHRSIAFVFLRPWGYEKKSACTDFLTQINVLNKKTIGYDFLAYHLCPADIFKKAQHKDSPGIVIVGKYVK